MFQPNDYLMVVDTQGNYRYGYITRVDNNEMELCLSFYDEGLSKVEYDEMLSKLKADGSTDWAKILTDREKSIVPLIANLMGTNEIADELKISPITVRSHIRTLRLKLKMDNRIQLIYYCQGLRRKLGGKDS